MKRPLRPAHSELGLSAGGLSVCVCQKTLNQLAPAVGVKVAGSRDFPQAAAPQPCGVLANGN